MVSKYNVQWDLCHFRCSYDTNIDTPKQYNLSCCTHSTTTGHHLCLFSDGDLFSHSLLSSTFIPTSCSPTIIDFALNSLPPSLDLPTTLNINAHFRDPPTNANFFKWWFHFWTVLRIHRLSHIIENDPQAKSDPCIEQWYIVDQLVMSWILVTNISPPIENMIQCYISAKECWEVLNQYLSPSCAINVKALRDKLHKTRKTPTASMKDYLVIIKMTIDSL